MSDLGKLWLLFASVALAISLAAFFMAPAFSPALMLSLVSIPLAAFCGLGGAPRTSILAVYFGLGAWLPFWLPRHSSLMFGEVFAGVIGCSIVLVLVLALWGRFSASAT